MNPFQKLWSMWHSKKMNLFQRLSIGFFAILICISVVLTGGFSVYYKRQADKSVYESIRQIANTNAKNISGAFNQVERAIETMNSESSGIQDKLLLYEGDAFSLIESFYQTIDLLENYINIALRSFTNKYHTYFFLDAEYELFDQLTAVELENASLDGAAWVYSNEKVSEEDWFQKAMTQPNQSIWLTIKDGGKEQLCMARSLQYLTVTGDIKVEKVTLGVIFISMDTDWILEYIDASELSADTVFWLTNAAGEILYSSNPEMVETIQDDWIADTAEKGRIMNLQNEKYAIEITHVTQELNLVTLVPTNEISQSAFKSLWPFFLLLLVVIVMAGGVSIWFSRRMTRDILHMAKHMRNPQIASIEPAYPILDEDIEVLYASYNTLVAQVQESIRRKMEHMEEMREMELNLMQAQINPHFLCNSLNSVYNVAVLHNEEAMAKALQGLCVFLRYNVSAPNIEVPLQRELDMLENYILLQNFLCGDRIVFDYEISVDSEQTRIPKMLLQPLVENSIMHSTGNEYIEISISCELKEDKFCILVEDNGRECNVDAINQMLGEGVDNTVLKSHGFGISNVHQRIKIRYDDSYGLYYKKAEEGGVVACVELPASVAVV